MSGGGGEVITSIFTSIVQSFKRALFPPKCHVCRAFFNHLDSELPIRRQPVNGGDAGLEISAIFERLMGPYLCPTSIDDFLVVKSPLCPRCGIMFAGREDSDHLCGDCLKRPKKYGRARSAGIYDGSLLALIHQLKYRGRIELARPLGKLLYQIYTRLWADKDIDLVVPVPLHPRKQRRRGFNQAHLLTAGWRRYFSHENGGKRTEIRSDILCRVRWTAPQTGLGRQERQRNIKDAFAICDEVRIGNCTVLLVDDVYTTGVTAAECARVLLAGGAKQVDVLTLART